MDHDIFSCNVTSSFLDDLSEISQEPLNICNYPQTSRLQNSNAYNRELCASQSTMNYYPVASSLPSHQNYQRSNTYNYNFPNYEYNANIPDQRSNLPYVKSSNSDPRVFDMQYENLKMMENDRMNIQPNNFISPKSTIPNNYIENKYQNFPKYYSMSKNNYQPNQLYRTPELSGSSHNESLCMTYQYPPQYFPNGNQPMYYEHGVSHFDERNKVERVIYQNIASIDQNIYNLETKLHFLSSNLSSNPNYIHEINEIKEKLIYFNQLKEKYLLSRNKLNFNYSNKNDINENKDVGLKQMNNYVGPPRSDGYNSQNSNVSQFYSRNIHKPYDPYMYNFMPNNQPYSEKFVQNEPPIEVEKPFPNNMVDASVPKSFISDLTGSDFSQSYLLNNKQHSNRDELSTPPISEFTDLTSMIGPLKSSHHKPNVLQSNELNEHQSKSSENEIVSNLQSNYKNHSIQPSNIQQIAPVAEAIQSTIDELNNLSEKPDLVEDQLHLDIPINDESQQEKIEPCEETSISKQTENSDNGNIQKNDDNSERDSNEEIEETLLKDIDLSQTSNECNISVNDIETDNTHKFIENNDDAQTIESLDKNEVITDNKTEHDNEIPNAHDDVDESNYIDSFSVENNDNSDFLHVSYTDEVDFKVNSNKSDCDLENNELHFDNEISEVLDKVSDDVEPSISSDLAVTNIITSEKPAFNVVKFKKGLRNNYNLKVSKWSFKFKRYYFYLKLKKLNPKYYVNKRLKLNTETSINTSESEISKNIDIKKKPNSNTFSKAKRMKSVESFLKKKNSKGSYFNNFDIEEMNISKKSLRSSTEFHITTRVKKDTNFEMDSNEENSMNSDDEIHSNFELNLENQNKIVQKILGSRIVSISDMLEISLKGPETEIEEYYLKYRGYSYIHCEWKSAESVSDPTFASKLKRYKNMKMNNVDEPDECLFNPDYVEIDRVLETKQLETIKKSDLVSTESEVQSKETITYYLVKWRSLPYEEVTWEKSENVDPAKVKEYIQRTANAYYENAEISKPTHKSWKPVTMNKIYKNGNILRDYQLEGVNWLTFCWLTNRNCILADEMGLGKTIQSIAFLIELFEYGFKGPFLIIVPLSTLGNWQREFEQWSNLNVILYHGSAKSRRLIQNYESVLKSFEFPHSTKLIFNAIITTYEVLLSDLLFFSKFQWTASIIDEAHRLKNKRCKLIEGLRMLDLQFRVLLTGTPLQNNVQELFNLLNFLESSKFFCESDFLSQYGDLRSEEQVASLKILLQPMMLRRLKEDVEKSLAPKEEIVVEVELTNIQKKYYRAILERNFTFLSKGVSGNNIPNLMNTMMELRKCCNHPFLIKGAEEAILNNFKSGTDMGNITKFIQNKITDEETLQFYSMVYSSGKLVLIHKLLPKLKQDGHKVLIFSQMVRVLDILEDYLIYEKYQYERIDGRIHGLLRQEAIDRFTSDPEKFIFLLCTKAGGLGINLTAADVVIIYDSDWNPQNDLQAQARCHRIGQQKLVNVYRLITRNTYEREMFDRASLKLGLDKAILQSMTYTESKPVSQLSKKEIEDLLKLGAYGALMDDDKDGEKFCEEDIDKILLSRSTVVRLNSTDRNSSFSKASFSISDNRSDIKLDDPNFWQKWAKKAGVDESEICNSLIMDKPRLRRQTNRYKPNCTLFDEISGDDSNSSIFDLSKAPYHSNNKISICPKIKKKNLKNYSLNLSNDIKDNEFEDNIYKPTQDMDRYDLFKAEKCLLQFGWGRWDHALEKISFKIPITVKELELLCRTILHYAHRHYSGDDRIYSFIEDLMLPESDFTSMKQHLGYSAPVARGRRGRKGLEEMISAITKKDSTVNESKNVVKKNSEVSEDVNLDEEHSDVFTNISTPVSVNGDNSDNGSEFSSLVCPNFRKHIQRTSHKLLHRIQFLYFLNHEIIGLQRAQLILNNTSYTEIPGFPELKLFSYLDSDYLPSWWNTTVDKCLLLGIFKHGWEKYDDIYKDPCFGFIDWLAGSNYPTCSDDETEIKSAHEKMNNKSSSQVNKSLVEKSDSGQLDSVEKSTDIDRKDDFPTNAELNIRLRKIIGSFQKLWRQKEIEKTKTKATYQSLDSISLTSEMTNHINNDGKITKWSRREETEFYRAINSYGIEKSPTGDEIIWTNFRNTCNLPRKSNESLTEYFKAFYTMCQKICQKYPLLYEDNHTIEVENISTERASRCLMKINIISKIRNEILVHPQIEERIKLCENTNDFPSWWIAGYHDLDILRGISKYGATRTELAMISDSSLVFKQTIIELLRQQSNTNDYSSIETSNCAENQTKNLSNLTDKTENVDDEADIEIDETIFDIDSPEHALLESVQQTVYDDVCEYLIIYAINDTVEQFISNKKDLYDKCSAPSNNDAAFDISVLSKIGWPKERILFSRLELIVQTIEKGEWPFAKNQTTSTQDRETPLDSTKGTKEDSVSMFNSSEVVKTEPQLLTFKSKRRGRKRTITQFMPSNSLNDVPKNDLIKIEDNALPEDSNMRVAYDSWNAALSFSLSNDPAFLMQKMLQMTPEMSNGVSSSSASTIDSSNINRISGSNNGLDLSNLFKMKSTNNGSSTDSSVWSMSQASTLKSNKNNVRRGRRPKHTGPYEMSRDSKRDSTSGLSMFNNLLANSASSTDNTNSNMETIIPIINIFNGSLIYDETAPKRKNLETFLMHNANYMPYSVEEEDQKIFNKVAKARGQETGPLESMIFTQYMNFMMSTMLASQSPLNIYNSLMLAGDGSKSALPEEQMNPSSLYMQQYQENILSMLGTAGHQIPGLELKTPTNNEEITKGKKRSISPIKNTGIPVKVKSYSISHLTDDDNSGTPDENKTPAHSNLTTIVSTGDKFDDKQKFLNSTIPKNSNTKVSTCEPSNKLHISNQNSDILASYQAYLYSAMLYSDYISSMQQYFFLNNKVNNTAVPDIFNNFKHPQSNNNIQSNAVSAPSMPDELTLSSSNSKLNKRTKVTSFSIESMGIAAVVSSPSKVNTVKPSETSHISLQDVSDDYAVLDLSNR